MENIFGCLVSPIDLRDYKLNKLSTVTETLPDSYIINMTHNIKNQGLVSSCVPHAIATILEYHDDSTYTLSTNFIYGMNNILYGFTGKGQHIRSGLGIVKKYGDMFKYMCQGNSEQPRCVELAQEAFDDREKMENAYKHKIKSYVRLSSDRDIKYSLIHYGPVLASMKWYENYSINEDGLVEFSKKGGYGLHAIVIYGWDNDGWLCQNSWGANWGKDGLFKLKFDHGIGESFALIDDENLNSSTAVINPTYNNSIIEILLKMINKIINLVLGR